jgi:hypothetical protein
MAALSRLLEQVGGALEVLWHALALGGEGPEGELGVGIAEIGGLLIGVGGLFDVLGDAEPLLVDLAEQRIGFL